MTQGTPLVLLQRKSPSVPTQTLFASGLFSNRPASVTTGINNSYNLNGPQFAGQALRTDSLMFAGSKKTQKTTELRLKDYKPPTHLFDKTDLTFELLSEDNVVVSSKIKVRPNPKSKKSARTLKLDGAPAKAPKGSQAPTMELLEVKVNGKVLAPSQYSREGEALTLKSLPEKAFTLEVKTRINPQANRSLSGLYVSKDNSGNTLVTQCEAEGFRNMTFYQDRPDVLSKFTTTVIAPKGQYKQLLSNGNPGKKTTLADGRESITWEDPFKKPSYLFALVGGNLALKQGTFTTKSGRKVKIHIYVDPKDADKVDHAMRSIKKAMKWDEEHFGREYDLDLFQIVGVSDFNAGAMENKGLNIFNTSAILADPKTATDDRYEWVEAVIAHEYFHNWRGDRITCRDWFQLCLKEGLTVFTDQEFTSDMNSRGVKRIDDVSVMRTAQFKEDASSMAHPIRPSVVGTMDNFYTATVYDKGAEVIRMISTMLGKLGFRKAMDLYFKRHDGQAVTTEDFVKAMSDASRQDLRQFEKTWYNQAGTPTLTVSDAYDPKKKQYRLTIKQSTPPTPGQPTKQPYHIPVSVGLLNAKGKDIPLRLQTSQKDLLSDGHVLHLKKGETTFVFENVPEKPVPSILRNWSAPVKVDYPYTRDQLMFLMAHDSDGFNRWEAGQKLGVNVLQELVTAHQAGKPVAVDSRLIDAFKGALADKALDPALAARTLLLPSAAYLSGLYPDGQVDPDAIDAARQQARTAIGSALEPLFLERYNNSRSTEQRPYQWNKKDAGERAIKNLALTYLMTANPKKYLPLALAQFDQNHNITDVRAALRLILNAADAKTREAKLDRFYQENKGNPLAIDQWFQDQAIADRPDVLTQVKALEKHEAYQEPDPKQPGKTQKTTNPNRIRGLVGGFTSNLVNFHKKDGSGYAYVADIVMELDKYNPNLAAALAKQLALPHRYGEDRRALILKELKRMQADITSKNVKEIVDKTLAAFAGKKPAAKGRK